VVARELTKAHETLYRGTLGELLDLAHADQNFARGEITLVVEGAPAGTEAVDDARLRRTVELLVKELPPGRAAAIAAALTGAPRAAAYALAASATRAGEPAPPEEDPMP
jgi:16S rRNA (cytidine1402-2'-O)-methyltransferase